MPSAFWFAKANDWASLVRRLRQARPLYCPVSATCLFYLNGEWMPALTRSLGWGEVRDKMLSFFARASQTGYLPTTSLVHTGHVDIGNCLLPSDAHPLGRFIQPGDRDHEFQCAGLSRESNAS